MPFDSDVSAIGLESDRGLVWKGLVWKGLVWKGLVWKGLGVLEKASFFLISYNQESFIREAVGSAFAQTYSPLEIVLSDDHSTDATFDIMSQMVSEYEGPHEIVLNRNKQNLGLCANVNRLLDLSSGSIIVLAAGDDISEPTRVEDSVSALEENPQRVCVSLEVQDIGGNGVPLVPRRAPLESEEDYTLSAYLSTPVVFHGASRAFRRSVFEGFGPLHNDAQLEDRPILLRCLLLGTVCRSPRLGVQYRVHGKNFSLDQQGFRADPGLIFDQLMRDYRLAVDRGLLIDPLRGELRQALVAQLLDDEVARGYAAAVFKVPYVMHRLVGHNLRILARFGRRAVKNDLKRTWRVLVD